MTQPEMLYCRHGDEYMMRDPAEVLTAWLEDLDTDTARLESLPFRIEEWTVTPPRAMMPGVGQILDWLEEWPEYSGEWVEDACDEWADIVATARTDNTFRDLLEPALAYLANRIKFRHADRMVRTFEVTANPADPDNPFIDGKLAWPSA